MRKLFIILIAVIVLIISAYVYIRYHILKTKDFKPDNSKSTSALDLRPAIIAKLQQLVKDGSDGLYNLSIDKLEPNVISSTIKIEHAMLIPDSAVLLNLDKAHIAPDDVFKISFDSLDIKGIGIQDLLNKNEIALKAIFLTKPVIELYHTQRAYNKEEREKNDSLTLYQQLTKSMKKIAIDTVLLQHGTFINHNITKKRITRLNDVSLKISDLLIDSSTQYDRNRFLFAKDADISLANYLLPTPDSLYYFEAALIKISAVKHTLDATDIVLMPRGNRQQFEKKLASRKDMFTLHVPKFTMDSINWYSILNYDRIIIKEGTVEGCDFSDYFDRSVPVSGTVTSNNFPHQLLMRMDVPVYIQKINLKNCNVTYEELNPNIGETGTVNFSNVNGELSNITNIPEYIRKNSKMKLSANTLFLHKASLSVAFSLDLKNYKTGNFTVDATMSEMDSMHINPVAEPLGLISIKSGLIKKVVAHVSGTNNSGTGKVLLLYDDLHLVPLKKDNDGGLKKRGFTSFLANLILIKNANPFKGKDPRQGSCDFKRKSNSSFFNLIWKIILTGVLKTIGIPQSFAYK